MSRTIEQIRLENARWLCEHEAGGNISEWGRKVGATNRQQAANWIGSSPTRSIRSDTARKIEQAFGRPVGWLDTERKPTGPGASSLRIGAVVSPRLKDEASQPHVRGMDVTREWIRRNVGSVPADHLAVSVVTGDAMQDSLPDGTLVLVDRSVSAYSDPGVYVLGRDDPKSTDTWFRHVSRGFDGLLEIRGEHPSVKTERVKTLKQLGLLCMGRVAVAMGVRRM